MSYIYYTNPDGTIGVMDATHDQAGNLKPARTLKSTSKISHGHFGTKKSSVDCKDENKKIEKACIPAYKRKKKLLYNSFDIDSIFMSWKLCKTVPDDKMVENIVSRIGTDNLKQYFKEKLIKYQDESEKTCSDQNNSNLDAGNSDSYNGLSLQERYLQRKRNDKKRYIPVSGQIKSNKYTANHGGRNSSFKSHNKPKYGYARDRYGRIQERDHYIENHETNRYHDNSNYDREDDNDSMYGGFE